MKNDKRLEWLLNATASLNIDAQQCLAQLSPEVRSAHQLGTKDRSFNLYVEYLTAIALTTADDGIGLALGEAVNIRDVGIYGYLLENAATVESYLELAAGYHNIVTSCSQVLIKPAKQSCRLEYVTPMLHNQQLRQDIDLSLTLYLQELRKYAGADWVPLSAGFTYKQPEDLDRHHSLFGDNLHFGGTVNYLEIENSLLAKPRSNTDPVLYDALKNYANQLVSASMQTPAAREKVRVQLLTSLGTDNANHDSIAAKLNMSRSSLQRRLLKEGTTFKQVRDQVIYELAVRALTETTSSMAQIALMLGYSETSAFDRAFYRLSGGHTPLRFRHQQH